MKCQHYDRIRMTDRHQRVRSINHDISCATNGEAQQTDETLVQIILLGLPRHMEDWKSAFDGRGDREKSMERLLVDLKRQDEIRHSKSKPIPENPERLAAMNKLQQSGGQRSNERQEKCRRCGGRHATKKCRFQGTCYKCNKRGHKQEYCYQDVHGDAPTAKIQAMKALQLTKAVADQSGIRQELMSQNSNIWALDSASEEHTTPHKELLTDLTKVDDHPGYITADGNVFVPKWKGQVKMILRDRDGKAVVLQLNDVHYLPGSPCNLLSEGILREKNHFYSPALMQLDFSNAFSAPLFMAGKVPVMVSTKRSDQNMVLLSKKLWHPPSKPYWRSAPGKLGKAC